MYYDEDYDYLEELLEEAYLEGFYDAYLETPRVDRGLTPDQKQFNRRNRNHPITTRYIGNKGKVMSNSLYGGYNQYENADGKRLNSLSGIDHYAIKRRNR